jgi:hypothetical protein
MKHLIYLPLTILLLCGVSFTGSAQLLTESFETDGEGSRYTSNPFQVACDFFLRDDNTVGCLTNNPTGLNGSFYWTGEDTDSNPDLTGTGILTLNPLAVTGFALDVDVLLGIGRPNDGRFEPLDELLFQYNMDGGGWITFGAFYGSNDGLPASTGNLVQDTDLDGFYNVGAPEINDFAMQNFNFTIPATGNSVQVRFVMGQEAGTEEIMVDYIRINGTPVVLCTDPDVPSALAATPSTICTGSSSTLSWTGNLNDATNWHIYTGSCGGTQVGTSATNSFVVSPTVTTTYYIRGEDGAGCVDEVTGLCGTVTATVNPLDNASFNYGAAAYCVNASDPTPTISGLPGGTFSSTAGLAINAGTGAIDVSASTPATYTVTYTTAGSCPNSSNVSVTINALDNASFNYSAAAFCLNDSDPIPTITGVAGGTFSSTAGLSLNAGTGNIDLSVSTPGTYTVTYTTSGLCPNSSGVSVTVNAIDNASFNYGAASYCANGTDPTPTISGLAGGTFSSTAGLSINAATGNIDVSVSTPGTYTVTYTTAGSCPNSSGVSVTVNALDDASFNYGAASYCVNDSDPTPTISGLAGGTFSSTAGLSLNAGTGNIDLSASTPGTYTVTYTTAGPCPNSSGVSVTVNALDNASFSYSAASYCSNDSDPTPTITGVAGGTFSSGAGLAINAGTGLIDVSASTPGTYTVTYSTAGSCPNSSGVAVTINALDNASFNYGAASYCANGTDPTPTITGLAGGTFTSTAGLSINAGTGNIDLSASTPGTYTVTYTTAGTCPNSSGVSVTVNALDDASFSYSAAGYCLGDSDPTPTITGLAGGTFSVLPAGLNINPTTGFINIGLSTPNTYTVTYTTAGTCPNTSNVVVTIGTPPTTPTVVSPMTVCPGTNVILSATGSGTGSLVFYNNIPSVIGTVPMPPATGTFNAGALGAGAHTFGVTENNGTCQSLPATIIVNVGDAVAPTAVCQNINVYLDGAGNATIVADDIDGGSTDNCGAITLSASQIAFTCANLGPNNVTLTVTDASANAANCIAVVTALDTISPVTTCPGNQIETPDAFCNFTLPDYTGLVFASDNCVVSPVVTQSPVAGTVISGTTTLTMTANDGNGNTSFCTFNVTLSDATPPTAVCQNINAYLDGAGNVTIAANDIDGGSTDNCSGITFSASQTVFTCANIGPNNVTLTVTDGNSNSANCVAVVTAIDTISPVITCPGNQSEISSASCDFVLPDYTGLGFASDNCGVVAITQFPLAGTTINANTAITFTTTDASGNSSTCTFDVTLDFSACTGAECSNAIALAAMDPCGDNQTVTGSTIGGTPSTEGFCGTSLGTGGAKWYTFTGDGSDWTASTLNPGSNYDTKLWVYEGVCGSLNCVTGNDDFGATAQSQVSFNATLGSTYYVVVGGFAANEGSYELSFTNVEIEVPVADLASLADVTGVCEITSLPAPTATDNCAATVTVTNDATLPITVQGLTVVTWTYDDGNGNTSTQTQNVVITDNVAPTVSNPLPVNYECIGDAVIDVSVVTDEADNCSGPITVTHVSDLVTGNGCMDTISRTYNVADQLGNNIDVIQMIYIQDVTPPTASAPYAIGVQCASDVPAPAAAWVTDEADNCTTTPIVAFVSDVSDGLSCPETITRTYSVTDDCGNQITVEQIITVMDVAAPIADNPNLPTENTYCDVTLAVPTATDYCDGVLTATTTTVFPITAIGTTTVTWTYSDACGNILSQTQDVIIGSLNVSTSLASDGITILANNLNLGVTYQWIDCGTNQPIAGATSSSYTATYNGNFAVEITQENCTDVSACVTISTVGIETVNIDDSFTIYPNPTNSSITIISGISFNRVEVMNALGQKVGEYKISESSSYSLALPEKNGVYMVKIYSNESITIKRVVKK